MLNISSTTAVSWPSPVSTAVAPVSPVAPVQQTQASGGGNNQAQTGFGREGRAPQQQGVVARVAPEARAAAVAAEGTTPREVAAETGTATAAHDQVAQRQAQQAATKVAEQQQAKDRKALEHLQRVLSNMWEASADVVNRALGIEPANTDAPGNQSDTAPDLSQVAVALIPRKPVAVQQQEKPALEPLPWPVVPEAADGGGGEELPAAVVAEEVRTGEVVAYDERGNSSLAPMEAGSLISHRV